MHRLTDIDSTAREAVCTECGPVKIYRNGAYFACATSKKARMSSWAKRNPDKAKANRVVKSAHSLSEHDGVNAKCVICGPVVKVPYGRGFACPVSPAVLRRGVQEMKPQERCGMCNSWASADRPLSGEGRCSTCEEDIALQEAAAAGTHTSTWAGFRDGRVGALTGLDVEDFHGFRLASGADELDDDFAPAVPGWATLGSPA